MVNEEVEDGSFALQGMLAQKTKLVGQFKVVPAPAQLEVFNEEDGNWYRVAVVQKPDPNTPKVLSS